MNQSREDLESFRSGIYLHYKNHLYEADHLTHNATESNRIEVHYVGLQLDKAHEGPRHATREFREFLLEYVHQDGSSCGHNITSDNSIHCDANKQIAKRFCYLGPVFEAWMLDADPWNNKSAPQL